jgi:hypothetical protein
MKKLSIVILALMLASSCKKEKSKAQLSGTFTGTFYQTQTGVTTQSAALPVQVIISGNNFATGIGEHYYTVGDGTLEVSDDVLDFTNKDAFPANTQFNSSAALHDSYHYTIKGDSLLFNRTEAAGTAIYKLKKQ